MSEWIEWHGGSQPAETIGRVVEVRYASEARWVGDADRVKWRRFEDIPSINVCAYRLVPHDEVWINWYGGECPVPADTKVEYQVREGGLAAMRAGSLDWKWAKTESDTPYDLVAYRVVSDKPETALDRQVDGNHYKSLAIQPVEYIHRNKIGYFEGNVIKYVTRWRDKNGIADLQKAKHYIDLLIELEGSAK